MICILYICIIHLPQPNKSNLQSQANQIQVEMDRKLILSFDQNAKLNNILIIHLPQPSKSNLQNQAKQTQVLEMDQKCTFLF